MGSFLNNTFIQNAIIASVFTSIVCGIVGTIIVEKKLVSMSGGIAHSSFGGIGLGFLMGIEPIIVGVLFTVVVSICIVNIKKKTNLHTDTIVGMFWSVGMAMGILFIGFMKGYPPDINSYLFGQILMVSKEYLIIMAILTICVILIFFGALQYWKIFLFDEEFAKVIGLNTEFMEYLLYILISLSIVILIKVVGIILVIALLTMPASVSKLFSHSFIRIIISASIIGGIFCISGLLLLYFLDVPSGATIILVGVTTYCLAYGYKYIH